jgi:hypothetical protein
MSRESVWSDKVEHLDIRTLLFSSENSFNFPLGLPNLDNLTFGQHILQPAALTFINEFLILSLDQIQARGAEVEAERKTFVFDPQT